MIEMLVAGTALAYLVTIGSLLAYSAFVRLLENASVSTVATYAYVNPVVAVLLGILVLGERVSWIMTVGAVVIVLSVVLIVRSEQKIVCCYGGLRPALQGWQRDERDLGR